VTFDGREEGQKAKKKAKKFSVGAAGVAPETIVLGVACKAQASGQEAIGGLGQQRETKLVEARLPSVLTVCKDEGAVSQGQLGGSGFWGAPY
jgi:hypothetical protein